MNLVLFIHQDSSENGAAFKNVVNQNFSETELQTLQTFNAFKTRLKQLVNFGDNEIFILFIDSKNRLKQLTSLIDLLEDKCVLLILPDDSKATISIAHQFAPRFITYINNTYDDLCAVLNNMILQEKIR